MMGWNRCHGGNGRRASHAVFRREAQPHFIHLKKSPRSSDLRQAHHNLENRSVDKLEAS